MKFYPYKKRGGGESFSHAEGGGVTKSFGVVLMQELNVFAIVMEGGGAKSIHFLKRGGGGAQ